MLRRGADGVIHLDCLALPGHDPLNPALLLKYSESATLDPYAVSGAVSMALFQELMATASIVGNP